MTVAALAGNIRQTLAKGDAKLGKPAFRKPAEVCADLIHAGGGKSPPICDALPERL